MRPAIAIGNYDFRSSGTVAKSIEIAAAAAQAGLPVELWVVRKSGELLPRVPANVPIVAIARGKALTGRGTDLVLSLPRFAHAIRRRNPALLLSGGNHFHHASRVALDLSGRRSDTRLLLRASNSTQRMDRSPEKVAQKVRGKFAGADGIIAVAQELGTELRDAGVETDIAVIPNGVDLDRVEQLAQAPFDHPFLRSGLPVLVSMGRLAPQKGFDMLIRALARLRKSRDARLLLIGNGKADQRAELEALAAEEGVADAVDLLGFRDNPFAILSRADLFVGGSRWEGASNTLIEALACGLPLAVTDCPTGNREVVERGPYGTLAPVDDVEAMATAMACELTLRRDRQGQRDGARHWSLDSCLESWAALLAREYALAMAARAAG